MPDRPDDAPGTAPSRDATPALGELREAVRRAAEALGRLRARNRELQEENERLRRRVAELEADPAAGHDGTALLLDDDPDALRRRLDRYIDALDARLNETRA